MQNYLIDTHVLLWSIEYDKRLGKIAGEIISNKNNDIYISIASLWEMHIKAGGGKLKVQPDLFQIIDDADYKILEVKQPHLTNLLTLPYHHRDPFDRMIVAQARVEKLKLITADPEIMKYDMKWIAATD